MTVSVNMLAFREGKKQRCELCNQRRFISRLVLFHEDGLVLGDLQLCELCAEVLDEALSRGGRVEEIERPN